VAEWRLLDFDALEAIATRGYESSRDVVALADFASADAQRGAAERSS
jgi:hypothetical protein